MKPARLFASRQGSDKSLCSQKQFVNLLPPPQSNNITAKVPTSHSNTSSAAPRRQIFIRRGKKANFGYRLSRGVQAIQVKLVYSYKVPQLWDVKKGF